MIFLARTAFCDTKSLQIVFLLCSPSTFPDVSTFATAAPFASEITASLFCCLNDSSNDI